MNCVEELAMIDLKDRTVLILYSAAQVKTISSQELETMTPMEAKATTSSEVSKAKTISLVEKATTGYTGINSRTSSEEKQVTTFCFSQVELAEVVVEMGTRDGSTVAKAKTLSSAKAKE